MTRAVKQESNKMQNSAETLSYHTFTLQLSHTNSEHTDKLFEPAFGHLAVKSTADVRQQAVLCDQSRENTHLQSVQLMKRHLNVIRKTHTWAANHQKTPKSKNQLELW